MHKPSVQFVVYPFRLFNGNKEYLLLKRREERGGFWQGVSGWQEKGEELSIAVRRELKQVTGLEAVWVEIADSYYLPVTESWKEFFSSEIEQVKEWVFLAEIDSRAKVKINPKEHEEFGWFSPKQAEAHLDG